MEANVVTSIMVFVVMAIVARGYWPLITFKGNDWASYMIRGIIIVAVASLGRSFYWDVVQHMTGEDWQKIMLILGGRDINVVFHVPLLVAGYYFLRARWTLIPEEDRAGWYWWNAWAYPSDKCLINWKGRVK